MFTRTILFLICFLPGCTSLFAQTSKTDLRGTYRRYSHPSKDGQTIQTLKLSGTSSGTYTLTKEGGESPDYSSGFWTRSKLYSHSRDSLQVVILDYENEHEARYYVIQRTGCLTPIYDDGEQIKRANSFAPVGKLDD